MENPKKKINQNSDANRLSIEVAGFVVKWVWTVIKWRVLLLFAEKKNGRIRGNEGEGEGGRSLGYNLNITNGFNDRY